MPEWAEPYVAACYTNGITRGYDAKTYGGSDTVTTGQAALMLLKALGYFQYSPTSALTGWWRPPRPRQHRRSVRRRCHRRQGGPDPQRRGSDGPERPGG